MSVFQQASNLLSGMLLDSFQYNRENFMFDRRQRQIMEYQLAEMRIKQAELWRQDVRDTIQLAPRKMAIYLLVIALELNAVATALCKARVPPGVPPWLAACHTLAICSALIYLLLGLWFGLQAFVSAQAYEVRILTQLVRLPVPTWQAMEASRTYGSAYEGLGTRQMFRVPFAMGTQEGRLRQPAQVPEAQSPTWSGRNSGGGQATGAAEGVADPWGLEPNGEGLAELRPEVNRQVERQRHVWLVREAARFYQTYDAFCRISLSAGTSSLAQFFAFFCLSYVLTENAAPVAAWAGMLVFNGISIMFMRIDLMLSSEQYFGGILLLISSPILCAIVTYMSSKHAGDPGYWEYLMPLALFLRGAWFIYYLWLFRVKEIQNAAMLPMAFKAVLYIDPFAWAKHSGTWFKQLRQSFTRRSSRGFMMEEDAIRRAPALPSLQCMSATAARRPEDVVSRPMPGTADISGTHVSFRPRTFASLSDDGRGHGGERDEAHTGADIHGEKPGLVPWRYFFLNTFAVALMWWAAAIVAMVNATKGAAVFVKPVYGLPPGQVAPMPALYGVRVETGWHTPLAHPLGLACDPEGQQFATTGRALDGSRIILRGNISSLHERGSALRFAPAPPCLDLDGQPMQDLSFHGCLGPGSCAALVLPAHGRHLVSCPLTPAPSCETPNRTGLLQTAPVAQSWLEDRGGALPGGLSPTGGLLQPEELSSLTVVPCAPAGAGEGSTDIAGDCAIVGTTARRVVQLRQTDTRSQWVPGRLLQKDNGELPRPGAFALINGRYLGRLHRKTSLLHVADFLQGGRAIGTWALLPARGTARRPWASICAGRDAVYALEDHESPHLWRFATPKSLLLTRSE